MVCFTDLVIDHFAEFMKIIFEIFLLSIISLSSNAQGNPDVILGKWMTIEGNLEVEVYKQNNDFKAKDIV